jgi:hypothetical protein
MAIRNLQTTAISDFIGKNTQQNLVESKPGVLNMAKNVMIQNDQQISKAPGYTKITTLGTGPIGDPYDFQRAVDGRQFAIIQSGDKIYSMNADGTGAALLASGEGANGFRFVNNAFACYGSDGVHAYRFVDTGSGGLTKYNWGIVGPAAAPTIATGAGTLITDQWSQICCLLRLALHGFDWSAAAFHFYPVCDVGAHWAARKSGSKSWIHPCFGRCSSQLQVDIRNHGFATRYDSNILLFGRDSERTNDLW